MPSSSDELREKFGFGIVDGQVNDGIAMAESTIIDAGGWIDEDWLITLPKIDAPGFNNACQAAQFLIEEWDYGCRYTRHKVARKYTRAQLLKTRKLGRKFCAVLLGICLGVSSLILMLDDIFFNVPERRLCVVVFGATLLGWALFFGIIEIANLISISKSKS